MYGYNIDDILKRISEVYQFNSDKDIGDFFGKHKQAVWAWRDSRRIPYKDLFEKMPLKEAVFFLSGEEIYTERDIEGLRLEIAECEQIKTELSGVIKHLDDTVHNLERKSYELERELKRVCGDNVA